MISAVLNLTNLFFFLGFAFSCRFLFSVLRQLLILVPQFRNRNIIFNAWNLLLDATVSQPSRTKHVQLSELINILADAAKPKLFFAARC